MRAAFAHQYGPPQSVSVSTTATPHPAPHEILVKVQAASVTAADARLRAGTFPPGFTPIARAVFGITRPRNPILGSSFSGIVVKVGDKIQGLTPGQEVCGMTGMAMGAHAEFLTIKPEKVTHKPAEVNHDDAAAIMFGGSTALYFLRDLGNLHSGMSVLVNGASGDLGTQAVQLAHHAGARVTAVTSAVNTDLVRSLGATSIHDYHATPVTEINEQFDIVFDTVGNISPRQGKKLITPDGTLLLAVASLRETLIARGQVKAGAAPERVGDFDYLLEQLRQGHLRSVIEQRMTLDDIAIAHARVSSGRKVGSIIVHPHHAE
ncbi:NAD(P)-dependent alcohol dehydrogenase [Jonesia quinghaiensis]|uniref:NAD(P)-dependent alcohol dehydrogenase n=1 Tax=Jonesia quinghaiensis TaxID=262806 RepID=UPI0003FD9FB6|nr:NAD(P)-dependent alcohol dehydrogenase [Jonesia quinghaiensis]